MNSRYPGYHVMDEQANWDEHTQEIVVERLLLNYNYQFFTVKEAETLRSLCACLANDDRPEILQFVIAHIDKTLHSPVGEGERKVGIPKAQQFIREGLSFIERTSQSHYFTPFIDLENALQVRLLNDLCSGQCSPMPNWDRNLQQELFKKLLKITLEPYYSHPLVWSEIGYGGPAFPRGYVRTAIGQLDPWEAQPEHADNR